MSEIWKVSIFTHLEFQTYSKAPVTTSRLGRFCFHERTPRSWFVVPFMDYQLLWWGGNQIFVHAAHSYLHSRSRDPGLSQNGRVATNNNQWHILATMRTCTNQRKSRMSALAYCTCAAHAHLYLDRAAIHDVLSHIRHTRTVWFLLTTAKVKGHTTDSPWTGLQLKIFVHGDRTFHNVAVTCAFP